MCENLSSIKEQQIHDKIALHINLVGVKHGENKLVKSLLKLFLLAIYYRVDNKLY